MKYKTNIDDDHHVIRNLKKIIEEDGRAIIETHGTDGGFTILNDESIMVIDRVGGDYLGGCKLSTILHDRYNRIPDKTKKVNLEDIMNNQIDINKRLKIIEKKLK